MLQEYLRRDAECWRPAACDGADDLIIYLVDNSALKSKSRGVRYRRSMCLADTHPHETAAFGTKVCGVPEGEDWVRIGDRYLPVRTQGVPILVPQTFPDPPTEDPRPVPSTPPAQWANKTQRAEDLQAPFFEPGGGMMYQVVAQRVAIRASPSAEAPIQGCEFKGATIELFDWDETRKWRQTQRPSDGEWKKAEPRAWVLGWMMLDHEEHGPLLRPAQLPFQEAPLQPLCVAVHENNLVDLQMFLLDGAAVDGREADGRTPLMVATALGRLDCCALLLQARADPTLISPEGGGVLDYASDDSTRALLKALTPAFAWPAGTEASDVAELVGKDTRPAVHRLMASAHKERAAREAERELAEKARQREEAERETREREEALRQRRAREAEARRRAQEQELARLERQAELLRQEEEREAELEAERHRQERVLKGELCEVVRSVGVPVHVRPDESTQLLGFEMTGQVLELHEYDRSGLWRRAVGHDFDGTLSGWALISDGRGAKWAVPCDDD